jgi:hypothetical protein
MTTSGPPGSSRSGINFIPLDGETADVVLLMRATERRPALQTFAEVVHELAMTTDLTAAG